MVCPVRIWTTGDSPWFKHPTDKNKVSSGIKRSSHHGYYVVLQFSFGLLYGRCLRFLLQPILTLKSKPMDAMFMKVMGDKHFRWRVVDDRGDKIQVYLKLLYCWSQPVFAASASKAPIGLFTDTGGVAMLPHMALPMFI